MQKTSRIAIAVVILVLVSVLPMPKGTHALQASDSPLGTYLRIFGDVNRPLNLTYDELMSFPMVSEVAQLKCIDGAPNTVGNWTGIPLFYLLTLAEINSSAYKVATFGSDGYSSDLLVEDALKPTTILALKDNGTTNAAQIEPLPRLIVPNEWGYKWVAEVNSIEVVNSDYYGTWDYQFGDNATITGLKALPPSLPVRGLNFTFGNLKFRVGAFTNASINAYALNYSRRQISINVTVPSSSAGFADFILPQNFLAGPYSIEMDNQATKILEADVANRSYLYTSMPRGFNTVKIIGTGIFGFAPEINLIIPQNTIAGENVTFNASRSVAYGTIISYQWSFGDGTNGTGAVVLHSYNKEGTFAVKLNVTDNYGLSNSEVFTVTVANPPQNTTLAIEILLVTVLGLLIFMFAVLIRGRKTRNNKS